MMNQIIGIPGGDSHLQSSNREFGAQGFTYSIAYYPARIDIYYSGQVDKTVKYPDIGDISTPELINFVNL